MKGISISGYSLFLLGYGGVVTTIIGFYWDSKGYGHSSFLLHVVFHPRVST
jgi:hypothetical protein